MADAPTAEELQAVQDAIDAAVEAALAPLNAELADLRTRAGATEIEAAVADAVRPLQAQLDALTTRASTAEAEVVRLTAEAEQVVAYLKQVDDDNVAAAALQVVKDARTKILAEELKWDEAAVAARSDFYAGLPDAEWEPVLADLRRNVVGGVASPPPLDPTIAGASVIGGTAPAAAASVAGAPGGGSAKIDTRTATVLQNRQRLNGLPV